MKVLVLVGVGPDAKSAADDSMPLAKVHLTRFRKLPKVTPAEPRFKEFAAEVQRRLDKRVQGWPDRAFVYAAPTHEFPHRRKVAAVGDPNLLEAIQFDVFLWDHEGWIAGYEVLATYSKIIDE